MYRKGVGEMEITMVKVRRVVKGIEAVRGNKDMYRTKEYRYIIKVMLRKLFRGAKANEADKEVLSAITILASAVDPEICKMLKVVKETDINKKLIDNSWKVVKEWAKKK